jgi:hypothetical protein
MITVIECHPPVVAKKRAVELNAVKAKQQAAWSSGNYAVIGTTLQIVGEHLGTPAGRDERTAARHEQRDCAR